MKTWIAVCLIFALASKCFADDGTTKSDEPSRKIKIVAMDGRQLRGVLYDADSLGVYLSQKIGREIFLADTQLATIVMGKQLIIPATLIGIATGTLLGLLAGERKPERDNSDFDPDYSVTYDQRDAMTFGAIAGGIIGLGVGLLLTDRHTIRVEGYRYEYLRQLPAIRRCSWRPK